MSSLKKVLFVSLVISLHIIPYMATVFLYEHPQIKKTEDLIENITIVLLPILAFFASLSLLYKSKLSSNLIYRISLATSIIPFNFYLIAGDLYIQKESLDIIAVLLPLVAFLVPGRSGWSDFIDAQDIKRGIKTPVTYNKYKFRTKRKK